MMQKLYAAGMCNAILRNHQGYIAESKTVEIPSVAISGRLTDFFHKMTGLEDSSWNRNCFEN